MSTDVLVVGGGVIGTAIAWRAALAGRTVTLIDPGTGGEASLVAAGMLGPVSESVFGEQDLLALNLHAVARFPAFNAELEAAAGQPTGLRTDGTLAVAYDHGDLAALDRLTEFRHSIGLAAERLTARECRQLEPFLAPSARGGVLAAGDLSVDNRRYLAALRTAAAASGVRVIAGVVTAVSADGGTSTGVRVRLPAGAEVALTAASVVIAAGSATGSLDGLPDAIRKAIRPVKGQLLRLRHPGHLPPLLRHTIRATVAGRDIYLVPRADGEVVLGATQEERGDRDVTAGAVHDLLHDAMTVLPAVSELILAETCAGLRPGTSDNGPIVGRVDAAGLIIAAGHYRNGILLSAATADAVAALLDGHPPHPAWAPFGPGRLG
jgi:glycine oxidase